MDSVSCGGGPPTPPQGPPATGGRVRWIMGSITRSGIAPNGGWHRPCIQYRCMATISETAPARKKTAPADREPDVGHRGAQRQKVQVANATPFAALPLAVAGARIMLEQLERIFAHEPGVRASDDPEDVHKMRVATRRLRAARRVFRKAMTQRPPSKKPAGTKSVAKASAGTDTPTIDLERANVELKDLADGLGRVRDLDVFAAALRQHALTAPEADWPALERLIASRAREQEVARQDLYALLDSQALTYLRTDFHHALRAVAAQDVSARGQSVARCAPRLIARALRRLYRHEDTLLAPSSADLHEVRIAAKRVRYTYEAFAPAFGATVEAPIARLTDVQDTLGEIHDADVAVTFLLGKVQEVAAPPAVHLDGAQLPPAGEQDHSPGTDAAPIARLIARYRDEREAALPTFREQWHALPRPKALRRLLDI